MKKLAIIFLIFFSNSLLAQSNRQVYWQILNKTYTVGCGTGSSNYGDTVASGATQNMLANYIYYLPVSVVSCGSISSVKIYVGATSSSGVKVGIYSDNGGAPSALITNGTANTKADTANTFNTYTFTVSPSVNSGATYWVGILSNQNHNVSNPTGGSVKLGYKAQSYSSGLPALASSPTISGSATFDPNIYITVNH